ncbi:hypothetical protein P7K49_007046 [Saguinus oedipus]|uniref:Uncharacterized protein n=1 Tax=Saguinus oedipus TaxID=9490 RepID=A0ABQ9W453_SAGOE|nr:hypothetical protein P7K49_007046 [Saguinus oedipus]
MTKLIPRSKVVATKRSQIFSTASDNQPTVIIKVYEAEEPDKRQSSSVIRSEIKKNLGGKLSAEDKETMEKTVEEKNEWLESHQNADIEAKEEELEETVQQIISKL